MVFVKTIISSWIKSAAAGSINLNNTKAGRLFYDIIYNPKETIFLKRAKLFGNKTENGKMMFIYQAHQSFVIWHKTLPDIDDETINLLEKWLKLELLET